MSMAWRWRDEVREDGLWESVWRRFLGWSWLPLFFAAHFSLFYLLHDFTPSDVVVLVIVGGVLLLSSRGLWRDGLGDQLLFGLPNHGASLVAGRERIGLWRIERLVARGPLARREVTVYLQDGMPTVLLKGWSAPRRALAEQWLKQRQHSLPFPVAIEAPESPFLQPDTVI